MRYNTLRKYKGEGRKTCPGSFRRVFTMKFFVDTANVEDIKKANDMGIICGVTTNPSLIAKEGRDFAEVIKEITSIVDGPISGEVKATTVDAEGMIKEGREIAAIHLPLHRPCWLQGRALPTYLLSWDVWMTFPCLVLT